MIHDRRVAAIVPIKDHSERVKEKNFREFSGKPLYHHIIDTLDRVYAVDEIYIDTDSPRVLQEAESLSAKVRIIKRPDRLLGDHTSVNLILQHDVENIDADIYVQTHATNPLLRPETIADALNKFLEVEDDHDSLFGVNVFQSRFYLSDSTPVNHDPEELIRTQDLPPVYEENSCIYVFTEESFNKHARRIGDKPFMFATPPIESTDIDDEFTFRMAELLALYAHKT
jgi:CMP-N-acetylneuraminic acid synthetase